MEKKIKPEIKLGELLRRFPRAAEILAQEYHLYCFGCPLAMEESLAEGARAHGMTPAEIKKMITRLNQLVSDEHSRVRKKKTKKKVNQCS